MICPNCGSFYQAGAKFCPTCGSRLPTASASTTPARQDTTWATSPHPSVASQPSDGEPLATYETPSTGRPLDDQSARHIALDIFDYRDLQKYAASLSEEHRGLLRKVIAMLIVGAIVSWAVYALASGSASSGNDLSPAGWAAMGAVTTWGCFGVFGWVLNRGWFVVGTWLFIVLLLMFELVVALFIGLPYFIYYLVRLLVCTSRLRKADRSLAAARSTLDV